MNIREEYKVDLNKIKEEKNKNISIILEYIKKEQEISRIYDKEDGIDVDAEEYVPEAEVTIKRIENLLAYRELRTRQAYVAMICRGNNTRTIRERLAKIDKDRREKHNLALTSFKGLIEFAKKYNLEPIYTGNILSEKDIESHNPQTYDVRKEMTDAFLELLKDLGEYSTRQITDKNARKDIEKIQNRIFKNQRDYAIKQELLEDEGDIKFRDFEREDYRESI